MCWHQNRKQARSGSILLQHTIHRYDEIYLYRNMYVAQVENGPLWEIYLVKILNTEIKNIIH